MKKIYFTIFCILFYAVYLFGQSSNPSCPNGDFENNNHTNWQQYIGPSTNPLNLNFFSPGYDATRQGIHCGGTAACANFQYPSAFLPKMLTNGIDYYGGFSIPNQGAYCLRVGNNESKGQADLMKYTFTVTQQNKKFKFRYAVVLQDGTHPAGQQPSVGYYLVQGNKIKPVFLPGVGNWDMYLYNKTVRTISADPNNPFFKRSTSNSSVLYKDWQCVELDLSYMVGKQVSFIFWTKDCTESGHFGYAYLDGLCTDWPATANFSVNKKEFCDDGQDLIVDGSTSTNEDRYFLEVVETDAFGNLTANGFSLSEWFYTQVPNNINITQWIKNKNKVLKCNKYYKIKVAVMNDCALWNEKSTIVHYNCPVIDAGPNQILCCGEGTASDNCVPLGTSANSAYTYNWASYPSGFNSPLAQTTDCPLNSTAYILTVTDVNGCKATDSVIVKYKSSKPSLAIKNSYGNVNCIPCGNDKSFYAEINDGCGEEDKYFSTNYPGPNASTNLVWGFFNLSTFSFTDVQAGASYTAPNQDGILYALYTNGCSQVMTSTPVTKYYNQFPHVIVPNTFTPRNQDGLNDYLEFIDYGLNASLYGTGPAYGATDFELTIYDRWGDELKTITKSSLNIPDNQCLKNGEIRWDGRDNSGQIVPQGVYNYRLKLKLCGGNWWDVPIPGSKHNPCVSWVWIFCTKHLQGFINHVTVL